MSLKPLLGASSLRLSAIYGAILVFAFALAGAGAWAASKSAAQGELRQRIQLEMDAMQEEFRIEGLPAALAAIRAREANPGSLEYQLVDRRGRVLIGDLRAPGPQLGWSSIKLSETEAHEMSAESFLILTRATPDGGLLTIGDDLDRAEQVRAAVLKTLLWVGLGALLLALAAGVFATRAAVRRMSALSATMARVTAGEFTARAPEDGDDDVAQLGRGINRMLSRIGLLIADLKRVSVDVAHDLRTPLTHVRQSLEAVAQANDVDTANEAARIAQGKIDDVLRAFDAILRLAEIDSGAARARFGSVDLVALIDRVTDAYRPDIEAQGRSFTTYPGAPSLVVGDGDLIAQALANLIENAMNHTRRGAAITVSARHRDGEVHLVVEDEGEGISSADRGRVVEPFVRLDPSRSSPGSGLGLSIVSAIARLHGGQLILEDSEPGLRASVTFPARPHWRSSMSE